MEIKLEDCVRFLDDKRVPLSENERKTLAKKYPYYGAQGIIDYVDDYLFDGEFILVAEDGNNLKTVNEPIAVWATGKFWVNNHAHILGAKKGYNLRYIYYLLNSINLRGIVTGSAQPKLSQQNLRKVILKLPELQEQNKVAETLTNIDNLVINNKNTIHTLKDIITTVYNYWFVQFDFPDKEGKPYKSSGGKMVWNDAVKREIPINWTTCKLKDYLQIIIDGTKSGKHLQKYFYTPIDEIPKREISFYGGLNYREAKSSLLLYKKYDILIGAMRVYFHRVCIAAQDGITRTTTLVLRARQPQWVPFLYELMDQDYVITYASNISVGTQQPYVNWENALDSMIVVRPPNDLIDKYCQMMWAMIENILSCCKENYELTRLHDFLLPLLMNGQVTFKEEA